MPQLEKVYTARHTGSTPLHRALKREMYVLFMNIPEDNAISHLDSVVCATSEMLLVRNCSPLHLYTGNIFCEHTFSLHFELFEIRRKQNTIAFTS